MYKKVLVPLDGSTLAECSLPHIKELAAVGAIGEVILLQVVIIEIPLDKITSASYSSGRTFDYNAYANDHRDKSKKYLAEVQSRLASEGLKVKTESIEGGRATHTIIDYAGKNGVDLIVMATHGYTGMKKMLLGSVAFNVLHEAHVPVLLIRPESCKS